MRVIRKSNYDHEDWRGDQWFVTISLSQKKAEAVADTSNNFDGPNSDDYFDVVEDTYILPPDWEP